MNPDKVLLIGSMFILFTVTVGHVVKAKNLHSMYKNIIEFLFEVHVGAQLHTRKGFLVSTKRKIQCLYSSGHLYSIYPFTSSYIHSHRVGIQNTV